MLTADAAEAILREWLGKPARCLALRRLHGGMIHSVLELEFGLPPHRAVLKVSGDEANPFEREARHLDYLRSHSRLPVPQVYLCKARGELVEPGFLLLERLPGVNLGQARMAADERRRFDHELADVLLELHSHERETFGDPEGRECCDRWLDWFGPRIRENFQDAAPRLPARARELIPPLLERMPAWFAAEGRPTLVHGDIWATNVIVERRADGWHLSGLVDPGALYADVEYELAYLEVFGTVTSAFFERYASVRPLRDGYAVRRLYYWLNTLLLHVWLFGDEGYVLRTERIAEACARACGMS